MITEFVKDLIEGKEIEIRSKSIYILDLPNSMGFEEEEGLLVLLALLLSLDVNSLIMSAISIVSDSSGTASSPPMSLNIERIICNPAKW